MEVITMTIIGFNFKDIKVSRKEGVKGKINIKNNVVITDIKEQDLNLGDKSQSALKFMFEFSSKYGSDLGEIVLGGDLLFMESAGKTEMVDAFAKPADKTNDNTKTRIDNCLFTFTSFYFG